jgi:hypothetical protein
VAGNIEAYAKTKKEWLSKFLPLDKGIPKHDVYRRVFTSLDSKLIERCFMAWVRDIKKNIDGEVIAIDGKSVYKGDIQRGKREVRAYHKRVGLREQTHLWAGKDRRAQ